MVGAAIIQDLVAISDERQHGEQRPGLVIIDEFSAVGAPQARRLFGRGRGGWLSQVLGTQEPWRSRSDRVRTPSAAAGAS